MEYYKKTAIRELKIPYFHWMLAENEPLTNMIKTRGSMTMLTSKTN